MRKFMLANQLHSLLLPSQLHNLHFDPSKPLLSLIASFFTLPQYRAYSSTPYLNHKNPVLVDYLVDSLKFPKIRALTVYSQFSHVKSIEKPKAVVCFLKALDFSDTQILSSVSRQPAILFADVEKILKPKVIFFQELGRSGSHLAVLISKNPTLLTSSLENKLRPYIGLVKKVLELNGSYRSNDDINDEMFRILSRYPWVIGKDSRLLSSITYMKSCGIVGSQLVMLLKNEPRLFYMGEEELKTLVSRVTESGFVMGSRMLVYGVLACYSTSPETFNRKYELFQSFGFSRHECTEMFLKKPTLFKSSEAKLQRGIDFFLHTLKLDKSVLVNTPFYLTLSLEKRVFLRYRVLKMIKSRRLLEREPVFLGTLWLRNEKFVEKYISKFASEAEELLAAYEDHTSESSRE